MGSTSCAVPSSTSSPSNPHGPGPADADRPQTGPLARGCWRRSGRRCSRGAPRRRAVAIYLADCAGRGNAASTIEAEKLKLEHVVAVELVAESGEAEASRVCAVMRKRGCAAMRSVSPTGEVPLPKNGQPRMLPMTERRWSMGEGRGLRCSRGATAAASVAPRSAGSGTRRAWSGSRERALTCCAIPLEALSDAESAEIQCDEVARAKVRPGVMQIDVVPCRPARVRLCAPATLSARVRATSPRERGGVLVSPAELPWRPVLVMMSARL